MIPGVAADAELAESPGSFVGVQRLVEEVLVCVRRRLDHEAALELEPHVGEFAAGVDRGELAEEDLALGRVLQRAAEELAAGHVRSAGVDLHLAPGDPEPEVRARADDAHLLGGIEPVGVASHALLLGLPVEQHGAEEEVGELVRRHPRLLRQRRRRILALDPRHLVRDDPLHRG